MALTDYPIEAQQAVIDKAKELIEIFRKASRHSYIERTGEEAEENGKRCALAAINEILSLMGPVEKYYATQPIHLPPCPLTYTSYENFWREVKAYIEALPTLKNM